MAVGAIGLTPMLPVMSEEGKVEMPDLVRMTKSPGLEVLLEVLIRCELHPGGEAGLDVDVCAVRDGGDAA